MKGERRGENLRKFLSEMQIFASILLAFSHLPTFFFAAPIMLFDPETKPVLNIFFQR